jgi:glutathione synthase/RimK-type ligase-like ATP-grasp enzyme
MILLCGIPSEPPLAAVGAWLEQWGANHVVFNQRHVAAARIQADIRAGHIEGFLELRAKRYGLQHFTAAFVRLMDDTFLPEIQREPDGSRLRQQSRRFHELLAEWLDLAPGCVINRRPSMASNASKPYQAQLIRTIGFSVPATLITNDPESVIAFRRQHGRVIFKSISGARSIVQVLTDADLRRLDLIRWCPTQFQQYIAGVNVRVHTVGDAVFATQITTEAVDYRYATRLVGREAVFTPFELPDVVADRCRRLAQVLGLEVAGIDLKIDPAGTVFCFEVNPSPVHTYYEAHTEQPISEAIARRLVAAG